MSGYLLALVNVTDLEQYKKYVAAASIATEKYGGEYIVRGGEKTVLEGELGQDRMVIVKFKDKATAQAWYNSPEYGYAKTLRQNAATGVFVAVDGVL